MKFFKQEALLVIFLLGLNSCVQEPNRQSSEPDTEPYTSPVLPSPSLIKSTLDPSSSTALPIATQAGTIQVNDITPKELNGQFFLGLTTAGKKESIDIFLALENNQKYTLLKLNLQNKGLHSEEIFKLNDTAIFSDQKVHQIAAHQSGVVFYQNNCIKHFSFLTQRLEINTCNLAKGNNVDEILSLSEYIYLFGSYIPQEIIEEHKILRNSSSYHFSGPVRKETDVLPNLFVTQPVGGATVVKDLNSNLSRVSWGILPPRIWENAAAWKNLTYPALFYTLNGYPQNPFLSSYTQKSEEIPSDLVKGDIPYIQDGEFVKATIWQPSYVIMDKQKNIYFIDRIGQFSEYNYIRQVSQGKISTLISEKKTERKGYPQPSLILNEVYAFENDTGIIQNIAIDLNLNLLYILTNKNKLFFLNLTTNSLSFLADLPELQGEKFNLKDLSVGVDGNLYVMNTEKIFQILVPDHLKKEQMP